MQNSEATGDCCKDKGIVYLYILKGDVALNESIDGVLTGTFELSSVQVAEVKKFLGIQGACLIYAGLFEDVLVRAQILANLGIAHRVTERSILS